MAIVATRDVCRDEELFLAYGANYWTSRLEQTAVKYAGRLLEDYWVEGDEEQDYTRANPSRSGSRRRAPDYRQRSGRRVPSKEDYTHPPYGRPVDGVDGDEEGNAAQRGWRTRSSSTRRRGRDRSS